MKKGTKKADSTAKKQSATTRKGRGKPEYPKEPVTRSPVLEIRPRPNDKDLFDLHLIGANGENLMHGLQGYTKGNGKRAAEQIKFVMSIAKIRFADAKPSEPAKPGEPGGPKITPLLK